MSEPRIIWTRDIMPNRYRGYLPEKDQPDYDIMGRRDGAFELYGWIETGVTFHGLFLDLESAKACAEELEGSK